MVDIDTSGPDVDIDVPEEKEEAVKKEEVKVEQEETVEQVKETSAEGEEKDEEVRITTVRGVKRRIDKLTGKIREAERQKEEALTYAQSVKATSDNLKKKYSQLETSGLKDREEKIQSNLKATYATLAAAREAGDLEC